MHVVLAHFQRVSQAGAKELKSSRMCLV